MFPSDVEELEIKFIPQHGAKRAANFLHVIIKFGDNAAFRKIISLCLVGVQKVCWKAKIHLSFSSVMRK